MWFKLLLLACHEPVWKSTVYPKIIIRMHNHCHCSFKFFATIRQFSEVYQCIPVLTASGTPRLKEDQSGCLPLMAKQGWVARGCQMCLPLPLSFERGFSCTLLRHQRGRWWTGGLYGNGCSRIKLMDGETPPFCWSTSTVWNGFFQSPIHHQPTARGSRKWECFTPRNFGED